MTQNQIHAALTHALTLYDQKEAKKKGYNRYALGIYFQRLEEIMADIERGADPRQAIVAGFDGRLADACCRAIGATITTKKEAHLQPGQAWYYEPTTRR